MTRITILLEKEDGETVNIVQRRKKQKIGVIFK